MPAARRVRGLVHVVQVDEGEKSMQDAEPAPVVSEKPPARLSVKDRISMFEVDGPRQTDGGPGVSAGEEEHAGATAPDALGDLLGLMNADPAADPQLQKQDSMAEASAQGSTSADMFDLLGLPGAAEAGPVEKEAANAAGGAVMDLLGMATALGDEAAIAHEHVADEPLQDPFATMGMLDQDWMTVPVEAAEKPQGHGAVKAGGQAYGADTTGPEGLVGEMTWEAEPDLDAAGAGGLPSAVSEDVQGGIRASSPPLGPVPDAKQAIPSGAFFPLETRAEGGPGAAAATELTLSDLFAPAALGGHGSGGGADGAEALADLLSGQPNLQQPHADAETRQRSDDAGRAAADTGWREKGLSEAMSADDGGTLDQRGGGAGAELPGSGGGSAAWVASAPAAEAAATDVPAVRQDGAEVASQAVVHSASVQLNVLLGPAAEAAEGEEMPAPSGDDPRMEPSAQLLAAADSHGWLPSLVPPSAGGVSGKPPNATAGAWLEPDALAPPAAPSDSPAESQSPGPAGGGLAAPEASDAAAAAATPLQYEDGFATSPHPIAAAQRGSPSGAEAPGFGAGPADELAAMSAQHKPGPGPTEPAEVEAHAEQWAAPGAGDATKPLEPAEASAAGQQQGVSEDATASGAAVAWVAAPAVAAPGERQPDEDQAAASEGMQLAPGLADDFEDAAALPVEAAEPPVLAAAHVLAPFSSPSMADAPALLPVDDPFSPLAVAEAPVPSPTDDAFIAPSAEEVHEASPVYDPFSPPVTAEAPVGDPLIAPASTAAEGASIVPAGGIFSPPVAAEAPALPLEGNPFNPAENAEAPARSAADEPVAAPADTPVLPPAVDASTAPAAVEPPAPSPVDNTFCPPVTGDGAGIGLSDDPFSAPAAATEQVAAGWPEEDAFSAPAAAVQSPVDDSFVSCREATVAAQLLPAASDDACPPAAAVSPAVLLAEDDELVAPASDVHESSRVDDPCSARAMDEVPVPSPADDSFIAPPAEEQHVPWPPDDPCGAPAAAEAGTPSLRPADATAGAEAAAEGMVAPEHSAVCGTAGALQEGAEAPDWAGEQGPARTGDAAWAAREEPSGAGAVLSAAGVEAAALPPAPLVHSAEEPLEGSSPVAGAPAAEGTAAAAGEDAVAGDADVAPALGQKPASDAAADSSLEGAALGVAAAATTAAQTTNGGDPYEAMLGAAPRGEQAAVDDSGGFDDSTRAEEGGDAGQAEAESGPAGVPAPSAAAQSMLQSGLGRNAEEPSGLEAGAHAACTPAMAADPREMRDVEAAGQESGAMVPQAGAAFPSACPPSPAGVHDDSGPAADMEEEAVLESTAGEEHELPAASGSLLAPGDAAATTEDGASEAASSASAVGEGSSVADGGSAVEARQPARSEHDAAEEGVLEPTAEKTWEAVEPLVDEDDGSEGVVVVEALDIAVGVDEAFACKASDLKDRGFGFVEVKQETVGPVGEPGTETAVLVGGAEAEAVSGSDNQWHELGDQRGGVAEHGQGLGVERGLDHSSEAAVEAPAAERGAASVAAPPDQLLSGGDAQQAAEESPASAPAVDEEEMASGGAVSGDTEERVGHGFSAHAVASEAVGVAVSELRPTEEPQPAAASPEVQALVVERCDGDRAEQDAAQPAGEVRQDASQPREGGGAADGFGSAAAAPWAEPQAEVAAGAAAEASTMQAEGGMRSREAASHGIHPSEGADGAGAGLTDSKHREPVSSQGADARESVQLVADGPGEESSEGAEGASGQELQREAGPQHGAQQSHSQQPSEEELLPASSPDAILATRTDRTPVPAAEASKGQDEPLTEVAEPQQGGGEAAEPLPGQAEDAAEAADPQSKAEAAMRDDAEGDADWTVVPHPEEGAELGAESEHSPADEAEQLPARAAAAPAADAAVDAPDGGLPDDAALPDVVFNPPAAIQGAGWLVSSTAGARTGQSEPERAHAGEASASPDLDQGGAAAGVDGSLQGSARAASTGLEEAATAEGPQALQVVDLSPAVSPFAVAAAAAATSAPTKAAFPGLLWVDGRDSKDRPVVVINTAGVTAKRKEEALQYLLQELDPLVHQGPYVLVLVASNGMTQQDALPAQWMLPVYRRLGRAYRKNVQYLILVKPNFWLKAAMACMKAVISRKAYRKIVTVTSLTQLPSKTDGEVSLTHLGSSFMIAMQQAQASTEL